MTDVSATSAAPAEAKSEWEVQNAAAIAAEEREAKPFELVGGVNDETADTPAAAAAAPAPAPATEKLSAIQRLARMTVGQRVQAAMKGSKEDRFLLIRDGSKMVSCAVLESPKVSEQEIEMFAAMKNVQEAVLRAIAGKRQFVKNYNVVKALVNNPRCPLDLSLTLMKNLLAHDLKALSGNKNVSETVRKLALKQYKEKSTPPGGKKH